MKRIKSWIKDHKKEIMIGAASITGTALCFLIKRKGDLKIKTNLSLHLSFLDEDSEGPDPYISLIKDCQTLHLRKTDLKLEDLGKLGELINDNMPAIPKNLGIDFLDVTYKFGEVKTKEKNMRF